NFSRETGGILFDFSRQRLDAPALDALVQLALDRRLGGRVEALMSGAIVNETEGRAALHTLLRVPAGKAPAAVAGLHAEVMTVRAQCAAFVREVHEGRRTGAGGARFTDVVNIGIGGSDLGPAMATAALVPYAAGLLRTH